MLVGLVAALSINVDSRKMKPILFRVVSVARGPVNVNVSVSELTLENTGKYNFIEPEQNKGKRYPCGCYNAMNAL